MDDIVNQEDNTGIRIQRMNEQAQIPTQAEDGAAGYDLYAAGCDVINPGETVIIGTGIKMEIPTYWFGAIYARSGLSIKQGLGLANGVGER